MYQLNEHDRVVKLKHEEDMFKNKIFDLIGMEDKEMVNTILDAPLYELKKIYEMLTRMQ